MRWNFNVFLNNIIDLDKKCDIIDCLTKKNTCLRLGADGPTAACIYAFLKGLLSVCVCVYLRDIGVVKNGKVFLLRF